MKEFKKRDPKDYTLSLRQASELLGVHPGHLRRLVVDKKVPAIKLMGTRWRLCEEDIMEGVAYNFEDDDIENQTQDDILDDIDKEEENEVLDFTELD